MSIQNMIQFSDSIGNMNVFFDVNQETHDVENISVVERGQLVHVSLDKLDALRDIIAREYALSMIEMAVIVKSGMAPSLN